MMNFPLKREPSIPLQNLINHDNLKKKREGCRMKEILFIEDDALLNRGICMGLEREGYRMTSGFSIADAHKMIASGKQFDLLLLDANLPDGDGFALCSKIRKNSTLPVILLTARGMDCDMVGGLDAGADDYIVKPVSIRVLTARIQALFRRTVNREVSKHYKKVPFDFDFEGKVFKKNNISLKLGRREQKLLTYLIVNANQALSREQILDYVWSDERIFVENNALAVSIRRLREKIEVNPAQPQYIINVYGVGYMWSDVNELEEAVPDINVSTLWNGQEIEIRP